MMIKQIVLFSSFACLFALTLSQETTDLSTAAPEVTTPTEQTTTESDSTASPTTVESSTTSSTTEESSTTSVLPDTTTSTESSTATETTDSTSTSTLSTATTSETITTRNPIPKRCVKGKRWGSKENSNRKGDNNEKSEERKPKYKNSGEDTPLNDDDDDEEEDDVSVCAWVRLPQNRQKPELQEIVKKCDEENISSSAQSAGKPIYRRGPILSRHRKHKIKHLECRVRETASIFFRVFCAETCAAC